MKTIFSHITPPQHFTKKKKKPSSVHITVLLDDSILNQILSVLTWTEHFHLPKTSRGICLLWVSNESKVKGWDKCDHGDFIMTCYRESPIIGTSTAASLYAFLCLSFSVIIPAVKSLLGPPIFVYADLTVCCKFPAQSSKTPCSYIHYSEELVSKDAFSVFSCWTFD